MANEKSQNMIVGTTYSVLPIFYIKSAKWMIAIGRIGNKAFNRFDAVILSNIWNNLTINAKWNKAFASYYWKLYMSKYAVCG